jgi:type IV pilus assembly protein PilA
MANTHYDLLGVAASASPELIRSAYELGTRNIAHAQLGDREAALAGLRRAYTILSDPSLRASYDAELARANRAQSGASIYATPASATAAGPRAGVAELAAAAFEANEYGGFWARVAAAIVDGVILYIPSTLLAIALAGAFYSQSNPLSGGIAALLGSIGLAALYHGLLNSRNRRATWGRDLMGLAVLNAATGERIGFGRGVLRALVSILTDWMLVLPLIQLVTSRRQAISDLLAGTVVVRRSNSGGVALAIVIVVVGFGGVGLVGVLAAISLPAYQQYTVRAKVAEGLVLAESAKLMVMQNFAADGDPSAAALSRGYRFVPSRYVSSIRIYDGGAIAISYNAGAILPKTDTPMVLTLQANIDGAILTRGIQGDITWACASRTSNVANAQGLTTARGATLQPVYAPANCR